MPDHYEFNPEMIYIIPTGEFKYDYNKPTKVSYEGNTDGANVKIIKTKEIKEQELNNLI